MFNTKSFFENWDQLDISLIREKQESHLHWIFFSLLGVKRVTHPYVSSPVWVQPNKPAFPQRLSSHGPDLRLHFVSFTLHILPHGSSAWLSATPPSLYNIYRCADYLTQLAASADTVFTSVPPRYCMCCLQTHLCSNQTGGQTLHRSPRGRLSTPLIISLFLPFSAHCLWQMCFCFISLSVKTSGAYAD